jgi:hypothetical protein
MFGVRCSTLLTIVLAGLLAFSSTLRAADRWTLIDASLTPVAIDLKAIDPAAGVTGAIEAGEARQVPIGELVSLSRGQPGALPNGLFVLHTAAGERLVGSPVGSTAEAITWANESLGDRIVPLAQVARVDRSLAAPAPEDPLTEDVATLANGDVVRGVVSSVDSKTLTMTAGDNGVPIALANLAIVRFAATTPGAAAGASPFAITLADGSVAFASAITVAADGWAVRWGDSRVTLPADKVVRVDHLAGPVRWLSTLSPQVNYTPYLGEAYPPKMDATVAGDPIAFAGRTYDRGIGMHARTSMTFALDGAYATFRTRYATDPSLSLTDAVVRVRVDDRVIHEQRVRSGMLSAVVEADLAGAKTLTLQVDFGQGLHTHDRVNWIEPVLLKARPAPAPR